MPLRCSQGAVRISSPRSLVVEGADADLGRAARRRPPPRGSPGPSSCRGRCGRDRPARGRRARRPAPAPAARTSRHAPAAAARRRNGRRRAPAASRPTAITSAAAASIAGATVSGWCGSSMASPRSTTASDRKQVEAPGEGLELGELHRGRPDRPRPEPAAGPVGHRGVVGKAHHRHVDAREIAACSGGAGRRAPRHRSSRPSARARPRRGRPGRRYPRRALRRICHEAIEDARAPRWR